MGEYKRSTINNGLPMPSLPSTSMAPSVLLVAPSITEADSDSDAETETETKICASQLSASILAARAYNMLALSTPSMAPRPIPEIYEWIQGRSTDNEQQSFIEWVCSTIEKADRDERHRFMKWAWAKADFAAVPDPEENRSFLKFAHSTSTMAACDVSLLLCINERKSRFLKVAHSTSTMADSDRWSLQEEILKPFATALKRGYIDLKLEHIRYTCQKGMHGVYQCENALWIWHQLRNSRSTTHAIPLSKLNGGPRDVGKKIKEKFPESDMIEGTPFVNDIGFVTIKLSGKWIAKSIHKMLKAGIDTWAPKLPVERVIIDYPSLDEEMHVDLLRRRAIGYTLMSILKYSKVDVTIGHPAILSTRSEKERVQKVLNRWFSTEDRQDRTQRDSDNAYKDLLALWYGLQRADWIVYVTPVWKQEYIEMCFTAAKLEESVTSNRHKPARTSYAGYRCCTTELEDTLVDKAKICVAVEQGKDATLLGYTTDAVLDCVFTYAYMKNHRLAECKFNINDETLKEEGNTFVYLPYTLAKIRRVTDDSREDINELKKASELILGKDEGWEKGEERILGFHLLEFTEALEESCLSVLPHILCEYLYDLCKKFNGYYSYVCKVDSVTATDTLLLCEATAAVMEKCFHLLGITPTSPFFPDQTLPLRLPFSAAERPMDVIARDPPRKSRFELFSFLNNTTTHFGSDQNVSGKIDLSDFWDKESDSACGVLAVRGADGSTYMNYILLKDAIDAALEVKFETGTPGREVRGYVLAHYGDDFLIECQRQNSRKYQYMALLFLPNHVLEAGEIQLLKPVMAVPAKGSLVIKAYLEDVKSGNAQKAYELALDLDPNTCASLVSKAVIIRRARGKSPASAKSFLLRPDRLNSSAWYNLGLFYREDGPMFLTEAANCFDV
uniref:arginine--tRNA ligase n=1 Tax=Tanacetum cinerariifolium TaxID=118510 RepID=A0A6L2K883_TANCI|nr:arginine--tRNA ligase, chloroplastic/mitochondrial [Tanacetum cinerariifolium]